MCAIWAFHPATDARTLGNYQTLAPHTTKMHCCFCQAQRILLSFVKHPYSNSLIFFTDEPQKYFIILKNVDEIADLRKLCQRCRKFLTCKCSQGPFTACYKAVDNSCSSAPASLPAKSQFFRTMATIRSALPKKPF